MKTIFPKLNIDIKERKHQDLIEDTMIIEKIRQGIGLDESYSVVYADEEIYTYLHEELKKGNEKIKHVMNVYEGENAKRISAEYEKNDYKKYVTESLYNKVFYLEEYDAYFLSFGVYIQSGKRIEEYVFYKDEKKMLELDKKAADSAMYTEENQIIMMTDTANGVDRERRTITQIIDKKDVILDEEIKKEIYDSINEFFGENEDFYKKYNIPHKRGILLHGPPGNGKTTIIKSLIGTIKAPVVYWQITEYTNSQTIKEVFRELTYYAPAVLVIEDLESMPYGARSVLLNVLDGATTNEGLFVIGTTNYPERIDQALMNRPGRFDKLYEMKLPKEELRYKYLKMRKIDDFYNEDEIKMMVKETNGFSFVQLAELFRVCVYKRYIKEEIDIEKEISKIKSAIKKVKKGDFNDEEKRLGF